MPGGDGAGPAGGQSRRRGQRRGNTNQGRGQWIRDQNVSSGECTCPICGSTASHQPGIPCSETICPKCGQSMIRQ